MQSTGSLSPLSMSQQDASQNSTKASNKTKLPKLILPKFTGDPTKWTTFWDSFSSAIHANDELNEVDKFQYLKSLLEGCAAETISGLPLSSSNYKHAVDLLTKRFGSKQVIISKHIEMLMQLPKIIESSDLKQLRQLLDKTESAVRSLQGIGISIDTYGTFLTPVIMAKIPQELRLILSRGMADEWDLNTLIKSFADELQIRERCALGPVSEKAKSKEKQEFVQGIRYNQDRRPPTSSTLFSNQDRSPSNKEMWCTFCRGPHPSNKCGVVSEPKARKRILRPKGRCFGCLKSGHLSRDCSARCYRCGGKHHLSLCSAQNYCPSRQTRGTRQEQTVSTNLYFTQDVKNNCVLLQTARAWVGNPNGNSSCNVRILLDSCSQKSYISTRLRNKLGLPSIGSETVLIKTFGNNEASLKNCDIVQIALQCQDQLRVFVNAYEVELICGPIAGQTIEIAQQSYPHLQGLPFADCSYGEEELEVDIMIGADYYWSIVQNHVVRGEPHGPVAVRTRLGYVLSGPVNVPGGSQQSSVNMSHTMKTACYVVEEQSDPHDVSLKEELYRFWDYETLGIKGKGEEDEFYEDYLSKVKFNGSRYEVSLPFKDEHPTIPDNYLLARNRLSYSLNRLRSKPELLQQYDNVIKEQLNCGVVELIDRSAEEKVRLGTVHYIPHKEVVKEDRATTKLRVVYDASAKSSGEPSLNNCLLPGPALTPLIFDILLRFRLQKVALIGDLEKAFLNIEVVPEERDFLRFLWIDDINSSNPEILTLRFSRLVFGLVCSPFILNVTLRNHLLKYENIDPEFVHNVIRALYVDDFASGKNSVKDCFELYQKLKSRFSEGGFNMRKWASNDQELNRLIEKEEIKKSSTSKVSPEITSASTSPTDKTGDHDCAKVASNSAGCEETPMKVMGVPWDRMEDTLKYDLTIFDNHTVDEALTKRKLLTMTARFYDPLGLLSPVMCLSSVCFKKFAG